MLITDQKMFDKMKYMAPNYGGMSLKEPRKMAKNMKLPSTVTATLASWFDDHL